MTEKEQYEVKKFLEAKGLSEDAVEGAMKSIEFHENTKEIKDSKEVSRARECIDFKPNPGKATLTEVGKVHEGIRYFTDPTPDSEHESEYEMQHTGDNIPIYQEDIDMIKKAIPLAKKLVKLQKSREDVGALVSDAYDLPQGPDTTECINEIVPDEIPDNVKRVPEIVKQAIQKSRGIKKNENEETPDVMWYFDPESELEYGTEGLQGKSKQCNKNVSSPGSDIDDLMYPSKEAVDKAMEESNKNVSCPQDYSSILRQMDNTHTRKNSDYGDAAYKGYKKYGDYYFLVQLHNKLTRLENLTINNKKPQVEDESIDDSLLDMANYAVMYLESRHRND